MNSVTYKSVIDSIAGYMGEADGLTAEDQTLARVKINQYVRLAWEHFWWPELMLLEQRTFRPAYASGTTYAAPTATAASEVYNPADGQYYQALQSTTGNAPAILSGGSYSPNVPYWALSQGTYAGNDWAASTVYTATGNSPNLVRNPADNRFYQCIVSHTSSSTFDATKFAILTPFVRSIDYRQANETALGEVRFLWDRDPTVTRYAQPVRFRLRGSYVQALGCANVLWVEFRQRPNVFNGATRSDTATYTSGTEVYDVATGDFWTANQAVNAGESPTSTPAKWDKVEFPYLFAEYAAMSVYAALTDREQEEPENFAVQMTAGYPLLLAEIDKIERQQGQTRQLNVVNGRRGAGMTLAY